MEFLIVAVFTATVTAVFTAVICKVKFTEVIYTDRKVTKIVDLNKDTIKILDYFENLVKGKKEARERLLLYQTRGMYRYEEKKMRYKFDSSKKEQVERVERLGDFLFNGIEKAGRVIRSERYERLKKTNHELVNRLHKVELTFNDEIEKKMNGHKKELEQRMKTTLDNTILPFKVTNDLYYLLSENNAPQPLNQITRQTSQLVYDASDERW